MNDIQAEKLLEKHADAIYMVQNLGLTVSLPNPRKEPKLIAPAGAKIISIKGNDITVALAYNDDDHMLVVATNDLEVCLSDGDHFLFTGVANEQ